MELQTAALTIFCGKGGVGKTTIALAYALRYASQSKRILVVTSHPLQELALSISLAGMKETLPEAARSLFIVHIDPWEILAHRVEQVVPSESLVKRVLASSIYKNLVEVAPGLKEISFLGRLHELVQQCHEGPEGYSGVIWDAPATGHFLQTLKVSQSFETYLSGPLGSVGKEVGAFFADASNLSVIPVTTLERMAVDETLDICAKLAGELRIKPAALIGNMVSPALAGPESDSEGFLRWVGDSGKDSEYLKFIAERHQVERALLERLRTSVPGEIHLVQRRAAWKSDLDLLMNLSRQLSGM